MINSNQPKMSASTSTSTSTQASYSEELQDQDCQAKNPALDAIYKLSEILSDTLSKALCAKDGENQLQHLQNYLEGRKKLQQDIATYSGELQKKISEDKSPQMLRQLANFTVCHANAFFNLEDYNNAALKYRETIETIKQIPQPARTTEDEDLISESLGSCAAAYSNLLQLARGIGHTSNANKICDKIVLLIRLIQTKAKNTREIINTCLIALRNLKDKLPIRFDQSKDDSPTTMDIHFCQTSMLGNINYLQTKLSFEINSAEEELSVHLLCDIRYYAASHNLKTYISPEYTNTLKNLENCLTEIINAGIEKVVDDFFGYAENLFFGYLSRAGHLITNSEYTANRCSASLLAFAKAAETLCKIPINDWNDIKDAFIENFDSIEEPVLKIKQQLESLGRLEDRHTKTLSAISNNLEKLRPYYLQAQQEEAKRMSVYHSTNPNGFYSTSSTRPETTSTTPTLQLGFTDGNT